MNRNDLTDLATLFHLRQQHNINAEDRRQDAAIAILADIAVTLRDLGGSLQEITTLYQQLHT